jgi:hypothetical protein
MRVASSLSGNTAPSISAQVTIRARLIGFTGNMLSPEKNAFPISAPAIPCVIVSIARDFPVLILFYVEQW